MLTDQELSTLVMIAGRALRAHLQGAVPPEEPLGTKSSGLCQERGAFVTLRIRGGLRGCIGWVVPRGPLVEVVPELARAAAERDPRFEPLRPSDLSTEIELEVSCLSPLSPYDPDGPFDLGKHGFYVVRGAQKGVLLPQVAVECGFDRGKFLEAAAQKAGLKAKLLEDPKTLIYTFTVERRSGRVDAGGTTVHDA